MRGPWPIGAAPAGPNVRLARWVSRSQRPTDLVNNQSSATYSTNHRLNDFPDRPHPGQQETRRFRLGFRAISH